MGPETFCQHIKTKRISNRKTFMFGFRKILPAERTAHRGSPLCTSVPPVVSALKLVVKPVTKFEVDFARIVPVKSAEGEAVVGLEAAVRDV